MLTRRNSAPREVQQPAVGTQRARGWAGRKRAGVGAGVGSCACLRAARANAEQRSTTIGRREPLRGRSRPGVRVRAFFLSFLSFFFSSPSAASPSPGGGPNSLYTESAVRATSGFGLFLPHSGRGSNFTPIISPETEKRVHEPLSATVCSSFLSDAICYLLTNLFN